jgi:hypothetical protein
VEEIEGKVDYIVANLPTSDGDDGLGFRREGLRDGRKYLIKNGIVFLHVSSQYGRSRIQRFTEENNGYLYKGSLCSANWEQSDLRRQDLRSAMTTYAQEEARGGLDYWFQLPSNTAETVIIATNAMEYFVHTGKYPLMKWQAHVIQYAGEWIGPIKSPLRSYGRRTTWPRKNNAAHGRPLANRRGKLYNSSDRCAGHGCRDYHVSVGWWMVE